MQIIHSTLRTMLSEAMREDLIERNVATVVRPPSIERVEVQPWSIEEASRFLAASAEHRLHALSRLVSLWGYEGRIARPPLGRRRLRRWCAVRQNVQRLPEIGLVFGPPKSHSA